MGDSTLPSVNVPEYPDEDSIEESLPIGGIAADNPEVDYMLVPAASSCGGDKLTDTNGFSYGVKRKNDKHTLWRCSVHNRHVTCKATVLQEGNSFTRGPHPHYISTTWLSSSIWPITSWSVFGRYTRTNNNVEGWHFRMNIKAKKGQLSFYMLLCLLYAEAMTVKLQVHLVTENKLSRIECRKYCRA